MATASDSSDRRRAELREQLRDSSERNAQSREKVRRAVANMRRIAAELRARGH